MAEITKAQIILTDKQITEIVQGLRGTTGELDLTIEAVIGVPGANRTSVAEKSLSEIDDYIFLCEVCGWWCDRDEEHEDEQDTCVECASYYVDEDDDDGYEEIYEPVGGEEEDEEE